jgi:hypothetical protein
MTRILKVAVSGFIIVVIVLALGSKDGAKAQPSAMDTHSKLAAGPIYPAGGSDGPPNL